MRVMSASEILSIYVEMRLLDSDAERDFNRAAFSLAATLAGLDLLPDPLPPEVVEAVTAYREMKVRWERVADLRGRVYKAYTVSMIDSLTPKAD